MSALGLPRPSALTAALAGIVAGLVWPMLWAKWGGPDPAGSTELIVATLVVVALPAHAFVVGFGRAQTTAGTFDAALLKRIGAWLLAAAAAAGVGAALGP